MIGIESYMNDGANWQAQSVLAYIRSMCGYLKCASDKPVSINVGRFENSREQGYVFSLYVYGEQTKHYAVYEHRNSDKLIVLKQDGFTINTPSVEFMFGDRDKWEYDQSFEYGEIVPCGDWIMNDMKKIIKNEENEKD